MSTLWPIATNIAEQSGHEIVDIEYKNGAKHDLLSIFIYHKNGINIDDCQKISRQLDKKLDELDLIKVPYYLEVSSPGLDRPLKTSDDYRRNLNKEVTVKLYAPIDGKKVYEGFLKDYDDEYVSIEIEQSIQKIPIKSISTMKQTIKF